MRLGAQHLLDLGHTRIAYLRGGDELESMSIRFQGFEDSMRLAGLAHDTCGSPPCCSRDPRGRPGGRILAAMEKPEVKRRHLPTSPFKAPVTRPLKEFAVGNRVTHDVHGLGRVTAVEDGVAVIVDFGALQERIISPYAKLTVL